MPVLTWLLLLANVGVFLFVQPWTAGDCVHAEFLLRHAAVPAELVQGSPLDAEQLATTPAAECGIAPAEDKNVYAGAVNSLFLHADLWHLLLNMLFLMIFGTNVEDRLGRLRFIGFYLACGLVATGAFVVANAASTTVLIGASGAIAGVLGAYLIMFPTARVTVWVPVLIFVVLPLPAFIVLGSWFVLELLRLQAEAGTVTSGGVAYLAHVAGFVAGAVLVLVLGLRPRRQPRRRRRGR